MSSNSIAFLTKRCPIHPSEMLNMICMTTSCKNQGLFCNLCSELHQSHRFFRGQDIFDSLKRLINFDGLEKTTGSIDSLAAKTTSAIITLLKELNSMTEFLTQKLESLRVQFDKYRQIANDVNAINEFIIKAQCKLPEELNFSDILRRICIRQTYLEIISVNTCQSKILFLPDDRLQYEFLDPLIQKFKALRISAEIDVIKPSYYNKLDLLFSNGLQLQPNKQHDIVMFEMDQQKEEEKVLDKQIEQSDFNPLKYLVKKQKPKEESGEDEQYHYGIGRVEKVFSVAGNKVWFHDFTYPRFKPKNWLIEPRNACLICKCHPKFAKIKEFLNCKYGDLYGPVHLESNLFQSFKQAVGNRKNKSYLVDKMGIYFHDLCVYWSNLVDCDELKGTIDFESFHIAIKTAYETFCYLCKRRGATLKCNHPDCEIWIHYYCWKELEPAQQYLDTTRFRMLCYRHVSVKYETPAWVCQNSFIDEQKELRREQRQQHYQKVLNQKADPNECELNKEFTRLKIYNTPVKEQR